MNIDNKKREKLFFFWVEVIKFYFVYNCVFVLYIPFFYFLDFIVTLMVCPFYMSYHLIIVGLLVQFFVVKGSWGLQEGIHSVRLTLNEGRKVYW